MLCDLLSGYGVPCIRKRTCLSLLSNEIVPSFQNDMTRMLVFLPVRQKQKRNTKASCVHTSYKILKLLFEHEIILKPCVYGPVTC